MAHYKRFSLIVGGLAFAVYAQGAPATAQTSIGTCWTCGTYPPYPPDSDGDGIPDTIDVDGASPYDSGSTSSATNNWGENECYLVVNEDGTSYYYCPTIDSDGDGLPDVSDNNDPDGTGPADSPTLPDDGDEKYPEEEQSK